MGLMQDDILSLLQLQMLSSTTGASKTNTMFAVILILFTFISRNIRYISRLLSKDLFNVYFKKNTVTIEGKRLKSEFKTFYTDLFSTRFKAVWEHVSETDYKYINSIKEISTFDYDYNRDSDERDTIESNVFVVNQCDKFHLTEDIYCKIDMYNDLEEKDNKKFESTSTNY